MLNLPLRDTVVHLLDSQVDQLPLPDRVENLYLDFETTAQDVNQNSLNPHKNCKIAGIAVLFENNYEPYYIPVRHYYFGDKDEIVYHSVNFRVENVHRWLRDLFDRTKVWINQNIKYDAHVLINETGIYPTCKLIDTIVLTKLSTFPEEFNYSLDNIMKMFKVDITEYEYRIKQFLGGLKDYALIPPDLMAVYAGMDVLACQYIVRHIEIHSDCKRVLDIENQLTPELLKIEQIGVRVNTDLIIADAYRVVDEQREHLTKIKELSKFPDFDPGKRKSVEELFCNHLGWAMPLTEKSLEKWSESQNDKDIVYSFNEASIKSHIRENPEFVDLWLKFQGNGKLLNSFIFPYLEQHIDGMGCIHCNFNQIVRTGRLSCRHPNMQQIPPYVRNYILPYSEDYVLVEFDLSQIEFRVIAYYIDNKRCIQAYRENPKTDYHQWVADICGTTRQPAKTINFMLGFGGGKDKTVAELSVLDEFAGSTDIIRRASDLYDTYHKALPELKPTQRRASEVFRTRGYVRTLFGRHRNLPKGFELMERGLQGYLSHKAFNAVCQGTAADFQKYITLRLRKFFSTDCLLHLLVHDCWLFSIRKDRVDELVPQIKAEIERPLEDIDFSIPILSEMKIGKNNWRECKE